MCVCVCVCVHPTQVGSDIAFAAFGDVIHPCEKMPSVPVAALHLEAVESEVVVGRPEVRTPLIYTPLTRLLLLHAS